MVPPPISVIGLLPLCCSQYSIIMVRKLPMCSDGAGAVVADIGSGLALRGKRVEALEIGALVNEAAFL